MPVDPGPCVVPDYRGACVSNLIPALMQHADIGRGWIPDDVLDAKQVVVLVIDGLGDQQLAERAEIAPALTAMRQRAIGTVAPTTTSTALTSIATGTAPGEHGVVGYKVWVGGEVLNCLRWSSAMGDARDRIDPTDLQPVTPFVNRAPVVISQAQFMTTGFTEAHLRETDYRPYWLASSIPVEVSKALGEGAPFVYAYYDGIDKIAHITGLTDLYAAELATVDAMVARIADSLPPSAALVVTADHGQVQVGENMVPIAPEVLELTSHISGEARFVWLHADGTHADALHQAAVEAHADMAWVVTADHAVEAGWFGPVVSSAARARLGDVALVAHQPVALVDPDNPGPTLQSRHGSLTEAEALVPLATAVG